MVDGGWGEGEGNGDIRQSVQIFNCKMNKFWGSHVAHGIIVNDTVFILENC